MSLNKLSKSTFTIRIIKAIFSLGLYAGWLAVLAEGINAPPNVSPEELKHFQGWLASYQEKKAEMPNSKSVKYVNELIYSDSPYLLQHAFNPINWKPWSKKILDKAAVDNKLILLSIGYSTCHWCHVMNTESFSSLNVAKLVNENYLAIKVDRELSPEVDEYYMSALQQIKGEAGWPITAIIDAQGLPVFVDSYLSEEKLFKLLTRVKRVWKKQPDFLTQSAVRIDKLVKANSAEVTSRRVKLPYQFINQQLKANLDSNYGGYQGNQKFPAESMLIYALDQLTRIDDKELADFVKLQLSSMSKSGIRDHIFGGFHRYSTTANWMIPHYEKMLYNQAQLIQVYSKAYQVLHNKVYLEVAKEIANSMLKTFLRPQQFGGKAGFITALDADFKGEEGGYYLWSKPQLASLGVNLNKKYLYQVNASQTFGLLLNNIPLEERINNQIDLEIWRAKLQSYKQGQGTLYFDPKVLTGWNGLAIKALADLSKISAEPHYLETAINIAERLWRDRFDTRSGWLMRTDSSIKQRLTYLEDYAHLSESFVALYDANGEKHWLERANELSQAAHLRFVESSGVIHSANGKSVLPSVGKVSDSEVFPAVAVLLEASIKIDSRLEYLEVNKRYAKPLNYLSEIAAKAPQSHLYTAKALAQIDNNMESVRVLARGKARVEFNCLKLENSVCHSMQVDIELKDGWHLNSNTPLQSHLVATKIDIPKGWKIRYPSAVEKSLSFQVEKLSLFEGRFQIIINRASKDTEREFMSLPFQVCSDSICLLPKNLNFAM